MANVIRTLIEEKLGYAVRAVTAGSSAELLQQTMGCTDALGELWPASDLYHSQCDTPGALQNPPLNSWGAIEVFAPQIPPTPRPSPRRTFASQVWESTKEEQALHARVASSHLPPIRLHTYA